MFLGALPYEYVQHLDSSRADPSAAAAARPTAASGGTRGSPRSGLARIEVDA